jgi:cell division transport system permease protein
VTTTMRINTFFYSVNQGLKNIMRNKMFSLASIATMAACIFMFGLFYIILVNFNATVRSIEEGVSVTVFFDEGISDDEISEIGQKIEARSEVGDCEFVSAQEAWEDYKKVYFEGREELAEGFTENPLANSAHFQVYLNDVSKQDSLVTYLEAQDGVREVKQSAQVANTLTDFNRLISYVSAGIILILLCVAVFLISNTVVVGISVRREEIAIMKLIGATDYLVRAPFVVEGIVIGLIGAAIPLALLYFLYQRIMVYIADQFNFIGSLIEFIPVNTVFRTLIPIAVLLGVGIGFLGSRMSVRKHLKV